MRTLQRALLVLTVMSAALVAVPTTSPAESPGWVLQCRLARSAAVDPIVHPGMPGMSHLHDFFANTSINAASTYRSMRAGGTTCPAGDTAGYWVPALLRNGVKVDPAGDGIREQIYFRGDNLAPGTHIEPFPPDLRVIAGNSNAASAADNPKLGKEIYWGCSDNSTGKLTVPPPSCSTRILTLHVGFPNCWDGTLTHSDDTPHLRYPSSEKCPAGFAHALPRVILRLEYLVGASTGRISLASGPAFTAHGDFWNTWDQAKLRALVDRCLNAGKDCGTLRGPGRGALNPTVDRGTSTMPGSSMAKAHRSTTTASAPTTTRPRTTSAAAVGATSPTTGLRPTGARTGRPVTLVTGLVCLGVGVLAGAVMRRRPRRPAAPAGSWDKRAGE
jgi:Domain of unknown function (DUF1996)